MVVSRIFHTSKSSGLECRVCVCRPGQRRCKLDRHDYTGLFLGYTATDQNIIYLDLKSGIVKTTHHATFDKAWYLQQQQPPAAQLLYNLGLEQDNPSTVLTEPSSNPTIPAAAWLLMTAHPTSTDLATVWYSR